MPEQKQIETSLKRSAGERHRTKSGKYKRKVKTYTKGKLKKDNKRNYKLKYTKRLNRYKKKPKNIKRQSKMKRKPYKKRKAKQQRKTSNKRKHNTKDKSKKQIEKSNQTNKKRKHNLKRKGTKRRKFQKGIIDNKKGILGTKKRKNQKEILSNEKGKESQKVKVKTKNTKDTGEKVHPKTMKTRAVLKGSHCQYIDLCLLDTLVEQGCRNGQKFVVKVKQQNLYQTCTLKLFAECCKN